MKTDTISRRSFVIGAACAGALAASSVTANAEETGTNQSSTYPQYDIPGRLSLSEFEASAAVPEPITEWDSEESYDIVVVGAGTAGVPAAVRAHELGVSVCLLQKEPTPISQGNGGCSFNSEGTTDPAGKAHLMHLLWEVCSHRSDVDLNMTWVNKSEEAMTWFVEKAVESGMVEGEDFNTEGTNDFEFPEGVVQTRMYSFENGMYTPINVIAGHFADQFTIHYSCPGVQLIKENDRVVGVFAKAEDGSVLRVNANKGVILATGDYENNDAMVEKYLPDALPFVKKQFNKTGDGHLMGMMIGAKMQSIGHTKMIHRGSEKSKKFYQNTPFLAVNLNGERFTAEDIDFNIRNNAVVRQPENVWISIFDADCESQATEMGDKPTSIEDLDTVGDGEGLFKADTITDLADAMGVPADTLEATVNRYNELCLMGYDEDFGKPSNFLFPIEKPPFYAIQRRYQVAAITSGLMINPKAQVLDNDLNPIPGLYAAGNCSGPFFGGVDYPMDIAGLSVSRAITFGYIAAENACAE